MDTNLMGFKIKVEAESGVRYLVLSREGLSGGEITGLQIEMMSANLIPGVVRLELRQKNSEFKLYYNLSGLTSLREYLETVEFDQAGMIKLISGMVTTITESKRYYLHEKCFVLDERYIFINPQTCEVCLLYIPVEIPGHTVKSFRSLMASMLFNTVAFKDKEVLIAKVLSLIREDDLDLREFNRQLLSSHTDSCPEQSPPDLNSELSEGNAREVLPEKKRDKQGDRLWIRRVLLAAAAVMSVAAGAISKYPATFKTFNQWHLNNWYLIVALMAVAAGALLLVAGHLFGPVKGNQVTCSVEESSPVANIGSAVSMVNGHQPQPVLTDETTLLISDETTVLTPQYPVLTAVETGEEITITKNPFVLGRNENRCDFIISNRNIGRTHARIEDRDGALVIVDLDSRNGTFLNGSKLVSSEEYPLADEDLITMANVDYIFRDPETNTVKTG